MTHVHRRPSTAIATLVLAGAVVAGAWSTGSASTVCGERDAIQQILAERYQERSRGLGLVSDKGVVELYISETGTWSILMTTVTGPTCIIAAGHTWQEMADELDGPSA